MSGMERVWTRIKTYAEKHAERRIPLTVREAKGIVQTMCIAEHTDVPPDEALEYLAGELVRLTVEGHGDFATPMRSWNR